MNVLYGISNCDTIRKARKWLKERDIDYTFHDFRKDGLNPVQLRAWVDELGWEALINK
ncbi:MAG: arsenate reductase, partial [Thiotrichales bacterium]